MTFLEQYLSKKFPLPACGYDKFIRGRHTFRVYHKDNGYHEVYFIDSKEDYFFLCSYRNVYDAMRHLGCESDTEGFYINLINEYYNALKYVNKIIGMRMFQLRLPCVYVFVTQVAIINHNIELVFTPIAGEGFSSVSFLPRERFNESVVGEIDGLILQKA